MKLQNVSFRVQIFLASLLLVILPPIILGVQVANNTSATVKNKFSDSMSTITAQANLALDTLLSDATKVADLHILNTEIQKIMITDFEDDLYAYCQAHNTVSKALIQANRMNSNVLSCMFLNRYGFTFEYNLVNVKEQSQVMAHMEEWTNYARDNRRNTYFGPLQVNAATRRTILPMVKVLYDGYTFKEIGSCYLGINFQAVENIIHYAQTPDTVLCIYNLDGELAYSSNDTFLSEDRSSPLSEALSQYSAALTDDSPIKTETLTVGKDSYLINGCRNATTGWHIIQFMDNRQIHIDYRNTLLQYAGIFVLTVFLGLILAFFLSRGLTSSLTRLSREIDQKDSSNYSDIQVEGMISNQELKKVVDSFNRLNRRLTEIIEENYESRLKEHQMHIQVLQSQINHHFLYNTLNIIKSLADIHNIPQIKTISLCMSDILRYNLKGVPIVRLEEELKHMNQYITIQNIRFPSKFTFECNIPQGLLSLQIPALILQPFIENSIEHGFSQKEADCFISISTTITEETLHFLIADNGLGIGEEQLRRLNDSLKQGNIQYAPSDNHHSIGIRNVQQRIQAYYGPDYKISIDSYRNQGTIIDLRIPLNTPPHLS